MEFGSSDTSCIRFRGFRELKRGAKNDEASIVELGRFLRVSRYIGMPVVLPGLERHMEIGSLKGSPGPLLLSRFRRTVSIAMTMVLRVSLFAVMGKINRQGKIAREPAWEATQLP